MKSLEQTYTFFLYTPQARILGHREGLDQHWRIESTLKTPHGIYFFVSDVEDAYPSLAQVQDETVRYGVISKRPFELGQAVDASTRRCVIALTHSLCCAREKEPFEFLREAQLTGERFTYSDMLIILRQAEWEGIAYPARWTSELVNALTRALITLDETILANLVKHHFG